MIKQVIKLHRKTDTTLFEIKLRILGIKFETSINAKGNYIVNGYPSDLIEVGKAMSEALYAEKIDRRTNILNLTDFNNKFDYLLDAVKKGCNIAIFRVVEDAAQYVCCIDFKTLDYESIHKAFWATMEKIVDNIEKNKNCSVTLNSVNSGINKEEVFFLGLL